MSSTTDLACLTCLRHGPVVGEYGYLGMPAIESLKDCEVSGGGGCPSFGYLYEGLEAVGLRRFDLDSFAEWLREHAGHRFAIGIDGGCDEMSEVEKDGDAGEAFAVLHRALEARLKQSIATGEYVQARHRAQCGRCGALITSTDLETFRPFAPYHVEEAAAATFLERWGHPDTDSWSYQLGGAVDPLGDYMPALAPFIEEHRTHGVQVELTTA